jgi:DNA-binding response OmpR family regulator
MTRQAFHVAVIDDVATISAAFAAWIAAAHPEAKVDRYATRRDAIVGITKTTYDVLIVDMHLEISPDDGIGVINAFQRQGGTRGRQAVMVVSERSDPGNARSVLQNMEVWDYLEKPKPFFPERPDPVFKGLFLQRFAVLLEVAFSQRSHLHLDGGFAKWKDRKLHLSISEYQLLHVLFSHRLDADPARSFDQIFKALSIQKHSPDWTTAQKNLLRDRIRSIREALVSVDSSLDTEAKSPIVTEHGLGYSWIERGE